MTLTPRNTGWIELVCGPMFSGKTEELIRRLIRAQIAKQKVAIFKPAIDKRYSETHIVSHNQRKIQSIMVTSPKQILEHIKIADVFGIDEAQFFDDSIVEVCNMLANMGKRVVIAGLEKDFQSKPFGPMPELMIQADYITKVLAICVRCGEPANFTYRTSTDANQVVVGESDKYEARCRNCFSQNITE
ncbi:thymidine kinase [Candidatus Woesearchaeota archaeon]|jgi:thymidine kinase|nr:thymidine kinase [Candidatus Woesearchaeota archaeon]